MTLMFHSALHHRYALRPPLPRLSVATVADFVDSHEHLPALATVSGDLKDVQRPWMIKAILGSIPTGCHLCEIGAGEPLVADKLVQLGYRVTVVDPYDGSGNGPTALAHYRQAYPRVRIIDRHFSPDLAELTPGEFDAVYSVSVLEHLDDTALDGVVAGSRLFLRPGGRHIHAIDFVAAGAGDLHHRRMLDSFLQHFAVPATSIDEVLQTAMADTETYFLSAEAHNRWRGNTPYSHFPMRKVISVQCVL